MTDKSIAKAISAERERCAKIAEAQKKYFLSMEYSLGQPTSSFGERFACTRIAELIREQ